MRKWMQRQGLFAGVAVVAALAVSCGGDSTVSGGSSEVAAGTAATPISVTLKDFSISPRELTAPAGRALTFEVSNDGPSSHTFAVIAGDGTQDTGEIQPNAHSTLQVPALQVGTYDVLCTVPGHPDLGMRGTLRIGEPDGAAVDAVAGMDMTADAGMSAEQMAEMHEASVAAFPAETEGNGGRPLKPEIVHGTKVFTLWATELQWEVAPGEMKSAMAYNGQVPGPEIRVHEGDRVEIIVQNQLSQPTVLHLHGLTVPNQMDGVPFITQDPIMPGGSFRYVFTVRDQPGTYVYHSHFNSTEQVGKGLFGAFIVEGKGKPPWDEEYTVFTDDGPLGYGLNGKSFPATQPLTADLGDTVLIRLANDGSMIHPMHLHGYHFRVIAEDGFALKHPYFADTLMIAPGQRFDVVVQATEPGTWALHCHILPHVEGPQGMFGMVTALIVE